MIKYVLLVGREDSQVDYVVSVVNLHILHSQKRYKFGTYILIFTLFPDF